MVHNIVHYGCSNHALLFVYIYSWDNWEKQWWWWWCWWCCGEDFSIIIIIIIITTTNTEQINNTMGTLLAILRERERECERKPIIQLNYNNKALLILIIKS